MKRTRASEWAGVGQLLAGRMSTAILQYPSGRFGLAGSIPYELTRAHGFKGPHGHCPALQADSLVRAAEHALIGLAEPLCGIKSDSLYGENRTKYLDLLIGACLKSDDRSSRKAATK